MQNGEGKITLDDIRRLAGFRSDTDAACLHWAADEIERLREALAPFDEAYRIGAKHCKYQTLGEWEALAKHHTKAGAYRSACLSMAENNSYLKETSE